MIYASYCDICKHKRPLKDGWRVCCDAFPDGIPALYEPIPPFNTACANGVSFEETSVRNKGLDLIRKDLERSRSESRND